MSELSEAEWNCRIAEAMGYDDPIYDGHECIHGDNESFSILTNPADCLAAIKHFRLSLLAPDDAVAYWHVENYPERTIQGTDETLEVAVFAACKQLVEE